MPQGSILGPLLFITTFITDPLRQQYFVFPNIIFWLFFLKYKTIWILLVNGFLLVIKYMIIITRKSFQFSSSLPLLKANDHLLEQVYSLGVTIT